MNRFYRIGWVTYDRFPKRTGRLSFFSQMRPAQIMRWINSNTKDIYNEFYVPGSRYDIVVFIKLMDKTCRQEVVKIKAYGGKVIFDANVNYYQTWGDYEIPGTKPDEQQRSDAVWMAQNADCVVADSTYLAGVLKKINSNVVWIPDNVDLGIFRQKKPGPGLARAGKAADKARLVWSGVAKKAQHLLEIIEVLRELKGIELVIASDKPPQAMDALRKAAPCCFKPFTLRGYTRVSPKRLNNAYEMAHTEYKIALGMAAGLPAVASPQQSYIEAISYKGGGFIAGSKGEWQQALQKLIDDRDLRQRMGLLARETIEERYSTEVISKQYLGELRKNLGLKS